LNVDRAVVTPAQPNNVHRAIIIFVVAVRGLRATNRAVPALDQAALERRL
jgi:hypothetical protein